MAKFSDEPRNEGVLWTPGNENTPGKVSGVNIDPDMRTMMRRTRNIYHAAPDEVKEVGMQWYDKVHNAAQKAVRGVPGRDVTHAAGVIAAVSPNMDWERDNIAAFDELKGLKSRQWEAIHESANQAPIIGTDGKRRKAPRSEAAEEALQGLSLAKAPDSNLVKAHRIWVKGEDTNLVIPRRTAPKTNSFADNIARPKDSKVVTVDGRDSDMTVDAARPWKDSRGISSAALKNGNQTRYESYEESTQRVAAQENIRPNQLQAIKWEMGKIIERNHDPERVQGSARRGQSYQQSLSPSEGRSASFNAGRS